MGTGDELALDVLLNLLVGFSKDFAGIKRVLVGGVNRNWAVPEDKEDEEHEMVRGRTVTWPWSEEGIGI